jgi:hypothetical protein
LQLLNGLNVNAKFQPSDNLCLIGRLFFYHQHSLVLCVGKKETSEKIVEFTRGFLGEYQHEQNLMAMFLTLFLTLDHANLKVWNLVSLNHGLGGALSSFCDA